jgi:hypothetical protein
MKAPPEEILPLAFMMVFLKWFPFLKQISNEILPIEIFYTNLKFWN